MFECKCRFSDQRLFIKFVAVKVVLTNKCSTTHALINHPISNQNIVDLWRKIFQAVKVKTFTLFYKILLSAFRCCFIVRSFEIGKEV